MRDCRTNRPPARLDILGDIKFPFFDVVDDIKPPPARLDIHGDIKFPFFDVVDDIKPPAPVHRDSAFKYGDAGADT